MNKTSRFHHDGALSSTVLLRELDSVRGVEVLVGVCVTQRDGHAARPQLVAGTVALHHPVVACVSIAALPKARHLLVARESGFEEMAVQVFAGCRMFQSDCRTT